MADAGFGQFRPSAPALVGRRVELAWLRSRLDVARRGQPHLVLLEGEAGVGKSRLAHEFLVDARRAGFTVVRGRCYEHLDLAYLPLRDSLFTLLANTVARRDDHGPERAVLDHTGLLDGLAVPATEGTDDSARTRQMLALTRLVIAYARDEPTVLFVDDLDWADDATTDLIRHLLFRLDDERVPLLLLATSRGDANARAAPGVARLRSEPRTTLLVVQPLSELEATELARRHLEGAPIEEARGLARAAAGNPLLVEALTHQTSTSAWPRSPASMTHPVLAALEAQLDGLGSTTIAALEIAALLAADCTRALVAEVTGSPLDAVDDAVEEAVARHVLVEHGDELGFAHPMYAHTVVDRISAPRRRALHARIADTFLARATRGEPSDVRSVAYHLVGAGRDADPRVTADTTRRAGDEAMQLGAWSEAARDYGAAIDALTRLGTPANDRSIARLHREAGLAHRATLELDEAVRHFEAAIRCLGDDADPAELAELHMWRIRCAASSHELLAVVRDREPLERLVEELVDRDPALAAEALVERSPSHWTELDYEHAETAALDAMALADSCGAHEAFERASTSLSVPMWSHYDLLGSLSTLEHGAERLARRVDASRHAGGSAFRIPLVLTWLGRLDEADARARACCAIAERVQYPLEKGLPLAALTQIAVLRGEFDRAERHAHEALLIQRLSGYHWAAGLFEPAMFQAHLARGRFDAARDALDTWADTAGPAEEFVLPIYRRLLDVAQGFTSGDGERLPKLSSVPMLGAEACAVATIEVVRHDGSAVDLHRIHDLLVQCEKLGGVVSSGFVALLPRVRGLVELLLGAEDDAIDTLERSIVVAERLRADPERARAEVDLASIRLRRGDRRVAVRLLDSALATFDRLQMVPDAERAAQLGGGGDARAIARAPRSTNSVILFTDVVDSTRLTEELGNARYRERARVVEDAVSAAIVSHGGRIVSGINLGDGFIGIFPTVDRALAAAQRCIAGKGASGLALHVALHAGEIIVDGPRVFGTPVNLAARICGLTAPDEILVSETIRDSIAQAADLAFVDRGTHDLKGIAAPQRLFAVVGPMS